MIEIIEGENIRRREKIIDQMFQMRAQVFHDRLKWDVHVEYGREFDQFDDLDPVYLVSIDDQTGKLLGSVRLLPTTGPNMLRDVFPQLMGEGEIVESPLIWESSRFSIAPDLGPNSNHSLNFVTTELLCGLVEVGQAAGIEHIVSVYDARMKRIFRKANCEAEIVGGPMKIGRVPTFAGLFDINQERWDAIAAAGDIAGPVIRKGQSDYELAV